MDDTALYVTADLLVLAEEAMNRNVVLCYGTDLIYVFLPIDDNHWKTCMSFSSNCALRPGS